LARFPAKPLRITVLCKSCLSIGKNAELNLAH